jgi:diguanylate cyclase (GGDEF)-like protein
MAFLIMGVITFLQTIWSKHLVQNQSILYKRAITDKLTNVYNRTHYDDEFKHAVITHAVTHEPLSLILIDIDDFKSINDKFGHSQGDLVLIEIANRLRTTCRKIDLIARIGGEEFAIILIGAALDEAAVAGEKIRHAICAQEILNLTISASIGVAELHDNEDINSLFNRADRALYIAKNSGKNNVQISA